MRQTLYLLFLHYIRVASIFAIVVLLIYSMMLVAYFNEGVYFRDFSNYISKQGGAAGYSLTFIVIISWTAFAPPYCLCKRKSKSNSEIDQHLP
jgi:hypothetical protein